MGTGRPVIYFRESGVADEPTMQSEIGRYIALPAQSLSYKIGQLKIRELRARAQQQPGPRFDIRNCRLIIHGHSDIDRRLGNLCH